MPLMHNPPLTMSVGRLKSRAQSVVSATAARCPPEDWPPRWRRSGVASGAVDVEPCDLGRSVGDPLGLPGAPARQLAVADAALDQLLAVGRIGGLVVGRV